MHGMAENSSYVDSVHGPLDFECWKNVKRQEGYLLRISHRKAMGTL